MLLSQVFCDHLGAKAASIVFFASESRSRPIGSSSERLCARIDDCDNQESEPASVFGQALFLLGD